jgi:hypothetical protein
MADKKKTTRTVAVLGLLVVLVLFFTWPLDGKTGYDRVQALIGASPTSTPGSKTTVIPKSSPESYQQEIVIEGRPKVDDGAHTAQPLDDLTQKDKEALDRLIQEAQKK